MAAARSTFTAAAAVLLAVGAVAQKQEVAPRCSRPFAPPAPSCFCSRASNGDWAVTCGCPDRTFPAGQEVVLTPKLLPPAARADGLIIALLGCHRSVRLSEQLLAAAEDQFASITLEASDTDELLLPELPAASEQPLRYNSITALLKRVSLPRITGALFSQRLAVNASFTNVHIGEIATGAFRQSLLAPEVRIVNSQVGRIAAGAFDLPLGVEASDVPLTGLHIIRSQVDDWDSDGHVGGVLLHVLDSNVTRLRTRAVSTAGLVELHWNRTTVGGAEPRAVYQHIAPPEDVLPPSVLGFYGNTFQAVDTGNDSHGLLHFAHGVPSALEFIDNDVWGASAAPVTPEPWPEQVAGTRLECRCPLLAPWLVGSEAFSSGAQCRPNSPGDLRLRRAANFYRAECEHGDQLPEEPDTRVAPPSPSGAARLAAAIAQLAAGFYSSRTLAGR